MGALLLLGRAYWKQIAVVALLLSLVGAIDFYKSGRDTAREEVSQIKVVLKVEHANMLGFQRGFDEQNKAIKVLEDAGAAQAKAFSVKIAQAAADVIVAKRSAVTIAARPQPKGKTACEAADDIFNEGTK